MQKKDCFLLGTVFKLHGYKGDVNIYNENDISLDLNNIEYFLIEKENTVIPFFISKARTTKPNILLVKFEDIDSEEEAKKIYKRKVYLPKDWVLNKDKAKLTKRKLVGYSVIDGNLSNLGKITYVNSQTLQHLIYVEKDGKEFCFPMHKEFVKEINEEARIVKVEIPKELLNLN